jgi:hypothetical protein
MTIVLLRFSKFAHFGGVKFGRQINDKLAFSLGFGHIILAVGAGATAVPDFVKRSGNGIILASDFLMTLQLGRAYTTESRHFIPISLPVIVVGGGLTAIDVATEIIPYYISMVEKISNGQINTDMYDATIVITWKKHYEMLKQCNNFQDKVALLTKLNAVTVVSRRKMKESNAYGINYKEVKESLQQKVVWHECFVPQQILYNNMQVCGLQELSGKIIEAKTIIIATGSSRNTSFETPNSNKITALGDYNPQYAGSVVKAIASAKNNYINIINNTPVAGNFNEIKSNLAAILTTKIIHINKINTYTSNALIITLAVQNSMLHITNGDLFQLKIDNDKPITVTAFNCNANSLQFAIFNKGNTSNFITQSVTENSNISIMGKAGNIDDFYTQIHDKSNVAIICDESNFLQSCGIASMVKCNKLTIYTTQKIHSNLLAISNISVQHLPPIINCDIALIACNNKPDFAAENAKIFQINYANMHCTLGGVCGRCLSFSASGTPYFACKTHIAEFTTA